MAIQQYLCFRNNESKDGIKGIVLAVDDAVDTDEAAVRARASIVVNNDYSLNLGPEYFDTVRIMTTYDAASDYSIVNRYGNQVMDHIS